MVSQSIRSHRTDLVTTEGVLTSTDSRCIDEYLPTLLTDVYLLVYYKSGNASSVDVLGRHRSCQHVVVNVVGPYGPNCVGGMDQSPTSTWKKLGASDRASERASERTRFAIIYHALKTAKIYVPPYSFLLRAFRNERRA